MDKTNNIKMVMLGGGTAAPTRKKKKQILANAMKRTSEWIFSQEIPSDVTIQAGGAKFSLHKFPLASKCGYIRKLVAEAQDADLSMIDICDIPGGAEAFELAAKFCYGINFEVSTTNIAMLRCAAEYLQMTEDYANANLVSRAEAYITEVIPKNLVSAVTVLRFCEKLLPMAEDLKIVSRCIETVASKASKESSNGSPGRVDSQGSTSSRNFQIKPVIDWWLEEIVVLRVDFFQRVITAMKGKGLKHGTVGAALMFYAQKSLRGLDIFGRSRKKIEHEEEQGQRILVETIVSLLPTEKNYISVSFLCWLLRTAIYLETTVACKLELEQRIGLQLEQATLDDLIIPSFSYNGDTVYAVDSMQRIVFNFLEQEKHCDLEMLFVCGPNEHFSSSFTDLIKVSNLLENYLAEIALDKNLSIAKFTALAELIPKKARTIDDGIYRAIDIYLKAHPSLNESGYKKVCSVMDCQKLSREACAHAAQNERLPVQIVVQVLYFEQQQLRNAVSGTLMGREAGCQSKKVNYSAGASSVHSPRNEFIELRQENQDLKLEIARLRMQLSDLEKDRSSIKLGTGRPPRYNKKFLNSVSRKLGKLNPFTKLPDSTIQPKLAKERRHSIS